MPHENPSRNNNKYEKRIKYILRFVLIIDSYWN
jgi:hypothetical protein